MSTGKHGGTVHMVPSTEQGRPARSLRQWWSVITITLAVAIFAQAGFAGAMLSGVEWGRVAHNGMAAALIVSSLLAGLVAAFTLRRVSEGTEPRTTSATLEAVQ
jgi:hypothetical protein